MGLSDDALAAFRRGDNARAAGLGEQLVAAGRATGNAPEEVDGLCTLARVALRAARLTEVATLAQQAREAASRAAQPALERMPIHLLAVAARMEGDLERARSLYEASIALNRELGEERMVAAEFHNLAYVELHDGRAERAAELFASARAEVLRLNFSALHPYLVGDAAVLAAEAGQLSRAARLAGAAAGALAAAGQVLDPDDGAEQTSLRRRLADEMGEPAFRAAFEDGMGLDIAEAMRETG